MKQRPATAQLDLITLHVTPEELKMMKIALTYRMDRWNTMATPTDDTLRLANRYAALANKITQQASL